MMKVLARLPIILIMLLLLQPLLMTILEMAHQDFQWPPKNRQVAIKIPPNPSSILDRIRLQLVAMQAKPLVNPGQRKSIPFPRWSWKSLMAGKFQTSFEKWLNEALPFRTNMVRIFNQIYYDYFSKSYAYGGKIIIGEAGQMIELPYINKYCNLERIEFQRSEFKQWVDELRELSEFFSQRGQYFIYLITPSKAAYFPEYIPAQFACGSRPVRPDYMLATEMLRDTDFPYVDGSEIVLSAKGTFPVDLFPRGGTHWNMLGAALVAQELLRKIDGNLKQPLPRLRFSYTVDYKPKGTDVDLLILANLWNPDLNYPVPDIRIENVNQGIQQNSTIALVGGSFLHQIGVIIQSGFFSRLDYFNYFKIFHKIYPGNITLAVDENDPKTYQALLEADVVLVEENEQNLRSNHVKLLREKLLP
jgi:hypothetical protein